MDLNQIFFLDNKIQEYEWGSYTAIQELLDKREGGSDVVKPIAELWMGAHHKSPSDVIISSGNISLKELIDRFPKEILGSIAAEKFHNNLPYLFKVLAVENPLSIQAHPDITQAKKGFLDENSKKIAIESSKRSFKDDNHKPECICALTEFWALNGFRPVKEISKYIDQLSCKKLNKIVTEIKSLPDSLFIKSFFMKIMDFNEADKKEVVDDVVMQSKLYSKNDSVFNWILKLHEKYPCDIGVLSPVYLNLICLKPGDALFIKSRVLHAYLKGVGIELMANSDNVLRGGLTPKHVDINRLIEILDFNPLKVELLNTCDINKYQKDYVSYAEEFKLSVILPVNDKDGFNFKTKSVEIILCIKGSSKVVNIETGQITDIKKGDSIIIPAAVKQYSMYGDAVLYKASVR